MGKKQAPEKNHTEPQMVCEDISSGVHGDCGQLVEPECEHLDLHYCWVHSLVECNFCGMEWEEPQEPQPCTQPHGYYPYWSGTVTGTIPYPITVWYVQNT